MPETNFAAIRRRLLSWYETHKRDLPWRRTKDPYAIWVSETMLQQTQVATEIPYYGRFMDAFPDIETLARAPLRNVLALWSGLGYYRRATNLKKAAGIVVAKHGARLPDEPQSLRALPGIGEYTAGAILSIAFDKPHAAVDGNTRRVLSRLLRVSRAKDIRDAAVSLISHTDPGRFNQALMELGSLVCTAKNPHCHACPLTDFCSAIRAGQNAQASPSRAIVRIREVVWPLVIVRCQGKLLLRRRASGGILSGMWEFPGGENSRSRTVQELLPRQLARANHTHVTSLGVIRHAITNRRIAAPVYLIDVAPRVKARLDDGNWRWITPGALRRHPTSSMTHKALRLLVAHDRRNA
jgi:A/G-specific adenine glycosylase